MTGRVLVAMPMKPFESAKTRLAPLLSAPQRERLVRALFFRTQRFFATRFGEFERLVVTPSLAVLDASRRAGALGLLEPGLEGLDAAAARACRWAAEHGYAKVLLIPGDIPVWICAEVQQLLAEGARHDVVVARARDGGTNALLVRVPTVLRFSYGQNSSELHYLAARGAGLSAVVCRPPFLAHDLDVPADCLLPIACNGAVGAR